MPYNSFGLRFRDTQSECYPTVSYLNTWNHYVMLDSGRPYP